MNQKHSKEYKSIGQTIKKYRKLRGLQIPAHLTTHSAKS